MSTSPDGQTARSLSTQQSLMDAAEKLIAKKGIHAISIKEIVHEAGQKNESALQYHFKNLQGLIDAISLRRDTQTQAKRAELLAELESATAPPSARDLCKIMVMPTFLLCQSDPKFRRYVSGFSQIVALSAGSALDFIYKHGGGGKSGQRTGELLRAALPHLDDQAYRQRMEYAIRLTSVSMGHHSRQKNAFKGSDADVFVSSLIDALEGLLKAPVSTETQKRQ